MRRAILGKFFGILLAGGVANLLIYMYRIRLLEAKSLGLFGILIAKDFAKFT